MSRSTEALDALVSACAGAPGHEAWLEAFRCGFAQLRKHLSLHQARPTAAGTFEAAALTARDVASANLPLGLALVMHLYPLCALRCVPLPWFSPAYRRRAHLLRAIDDQRLLLANAGSERAVGAHAPVKVVRADDGLRVDGTFDYVSLANVADLVMFVAPLAGTGRSVFCVADLRAPAVRIGPQRFDGNLRLSDTCSLSFHAHHVPAGRFIEAADPGTLDCMAQYQRSWFHLLLAEAYLARIRHLQQVHDLPHPAEEMASLNELACLREYALHLLNHTSLPSGVDSLGKVTAAIKLRVSWLAQAMAQAVQGRDAGSACELGFARLQPTSDDRILRGLGASIREPFVVQRTHLAEAAT